MLPLPLAFLSLLLFSPGPALAADPTPAGAVLAPIETTPGGVSSDSGNPYAVIPEGYTSPQVPAPIDPISHNPSPRWHAAHAKARAFLANWTVEEKSMLCTGTGWSIGRCVGNTPPIPSRNWTGLCLEDSPLGVRFADFVSAFPAVSTRRRRECQPISSQVPPSAIAGKAALPAVASGVGTTTLTPL
jgi:hypothetical protein